MSADLREDLRAYLDEIVDRIEAGARNEAAPVEPRQDPCKPTRSSSSRTRWLAGAALVIIAVSTIAVAVRSTPSSEDIDVVGPVTTAPPDPSSVDGEPVPIGPSLERADLADGSFENLSIKAAVWTGSSLILWRGEHSSGPSNVPTDRALSYDLMTDTWTMLPPDPLSVDEVPNAAGGAVVGGEALFWSADDLVAWNPLAESWRRAADAPRPRSWVAVSTDSALVFPFDGLTYDPYTDRWREIATPDVDLWPDRGGIPSVVWTGTDVVAIGARVGIYEPTTDTWRSIESPVPEPEPGFLSYAPKLFLIDGRVAADAGPGEVRVLDAATGTWTSRNELAPPIPSCEGGPAYVPFADDHLFATSCGVSAWRPPGGRWTPIPASGSAIIGTKQGLLLYGVGPDRNGLQLLTVDPGEGEPSGGDELQLGGYVSDITLDIPPTLDCFPSEHHDPTGICPPLDDELLGSVTIDGNVVLVTETTEVETCGPTDAPAAIAFEDAEMLLRDVNPLIASATVVASPKSPNHWARATSVFLGSCG